MLICTGCSNKIKFSPEILGKLPPKCPVCGSVLKPDFVFFGEPIPSNAYDLSLKETGQSDVFFLVGTTGEIQPASMIPIIAKEKGAKIIEVNIEESNYTRSITDVFIRGKAGEVIPNLVGLLN